MKTIELYFKGYKREVNKAGLEDSADIYCVYAGKYNRGNGKVTPERLLYIGKALTIRKRIGNDTHEHLDDWNKALKKSLLAWCCSVDYISHK